MSNKSISVLRLSDEELIGSKVNALIVRTTPRDIFDVFELLRSGYFSNKELIKKIAIFYICLGNEIPFNFEELLNRAIKKMENLSFKAIKQTLIPVLHKSAFVDINGLCDYVIKGINELFVLDNNDKKFISEYNKNNFLPDILFDGFDVNDVSNHPMALWKINKNN